MTTNVPSARTARVALAFSCLGHAYSHLFAPIFYVVVLALEHEFMLTHGAAAALIGFGVQVEGALCDFTGGFTALFVVLAAVAAVGFAAACLLPSERRETAMAAAE
jgi:FSR family fosmidomycin resistance protein-like MFS transporter